MRDSLSALFPRIFTMGAILVGLDSLPDAVAFIIIPDSVPWTRTASGPRSGNGDPAILTWSLVPDGTPVLGDGGTSLGGSNLISFLNDTFAGSPGETDLTEQPWFAFFADSFDRWNQLGGVTYQYEPNDDGRVHSRYDGLLGVRGDIRIGGVSVDGAGGTLAFNFLPNSGSDLVLDTDDAAFFANASGDHVRLRNTLTHELGHGFGLQHVNSNTDKLLLEPTISTAFDGPQLDEVRGVQFYFGDALEKSHGGQLLAVLPARMRMGTRTVAIFSPGSSNLGKGSPRHSLRSPSQPLSCSLCRPLLSVFHPVPSIRLIMGIRFHRPYDSPVAGRFLHERGRPDHRFQPMELALSRSR